jgi:hypothetical protein
MSITPPEEREAVLQTAGVPKETLQLIRKIGEDDAPRTMLGIRDASAAYYYLGHGWMPFDDGQDVTPVLSNANSDVFVILITEPRGPRRFVRAGLEEGVFVEYGPDFGPVVLDILIVAYEDSGWSESELAAAGFRLGFGRVDELYRELVASPRDTFAEYEAFTRRMRTLFFGLPSLS